MPKGLKRRTWPPALVDGDGEAEGGGMEGGLDADRAGSQDGQARQVGP
jgi:hypothetical protein